MDAAKEEAKVNAKDDRAVVVGTEQRSGDDVVSDSTPSPTHAESHLDVRASRSSDPSVSWRQRQPVLATPQLNGMSPASKTFIPSLEDSRKQEEYMERMKRLDQSGQLYGTIGPPPPPSSPVFSGSGDVVDGLRKSSVYGDRLMVGSAPPLSSLSTPTGSTVSSDERPGSEFDRYERNDMAMEPCAFCLRIIYPTGDLVTRMPCCGLFLHFHCLRRKGWHHMPAELACPECSKPEMLTVDYEKEPDPPDTEVGQAFASKLHLLIRKRGITTGLRAIHQAYKSGDGIRSGFPEVTKTEVIRSKLRINDLLTAGFNLDTIHDTMGVKTWADLKAIGFDEEQLPKLEDHIFALRRLYAVDSVRLRRDTDLTLKKLAGLNLRSTTLRELGFDTHELCCMGLHKDGIKWFKNLTMANWVDHLNFRKIHLGILRITRRDFDESCLAPVSWNPEALRKKLGLDEGEALRIRLIVAADLEQSEWHQNYQAGGGHSQSPRDYYHHHSRGYDAFRRPTQHQPVTVERPQQQHLAPSPQAYGHPPGVTQQQQQQQQQQQHLMPSPQAHGHSPGVPQQQQQQQQQHPQSFTGPIRFLPDGRPYHVMPDGRYVIVAIPPPMGFARPQVRYPHHQPTAPVYGQRRRRAAPLAVEPRMKGTSLYHRTNPVWVDNRTRGSTRPGKLS